MSGTVGFGSPLHVAAGDFSLWPQLYVRRARAIIGSFVPLQVTNRKYHQGSWSWLSPCLEASERRSTNLFSDEERDLQVDKPSENDIWGDACTYRRRMLLLEES